ncbi:MAG: PhzF family phenazine biosynthesis protein [Thermoanaerobaculia bacterium]|nr:PhzF family phenazine biosynthesis protein [Thermoanaerobaculia bacterium]
MTAFPMLRRLAAFTTDPSGGNPAGVWVGDELPSATEMQRVAADVGYSETAFVAPSRGLERTIRYYSPKAEVSFCGHATIATGVLLGELDGEGTFRLQTKVGEVSVEVSHAPEGHLRASLTSVATQHRLVDTVSPENGLLDRALSALAWRRDDLDPAIPPAVAYAGAWHLILAVPDAATLDRLDYDFDRLTEIMTAADLTTLQLIRRESDEIFHSRNPFPVGGVVEDPATGAAAAALGGYLRDAGLLAAPASFEIRQGEAMGRPSLLRVDVPASGGITVSGAAVSLDGVQEVDHDD